MFVKHSNLVIENRKLMETIAVLEPRNFNYDLIVFTEHAGTISFDSINFLSRHNISVYILNWDGHLISTILPEKVNNRSTARLAQYRAMNDPKQRLAIAKWFIAEKFQASLDTLRRIDASTEEVENFSKRIASQPNIAKLMMIEGNVADVYWKSVRAYLRRIAPNLKFGGRVGIGRASSKGAIDHINSALNWLYGFEAGFMRSMINSYSLDPCLSFLHFTKDYDGLTADFQELARAYFDQVLIEAIENHWITPRGFFRNEDYFMRLEWETRDTLARGIAEKLNEKISFNGQWSLEAVLRNKTKTFCDNLTASSTTTSIGTTEA